MPGVRSFAQGHIPGRSGTRTGPLGGEPEANSTSSLEAAAGDFPKHRAGKPAHSGFFTRITRHIPDRNRSLRAALARGKVDFMIR